MYGGIFVKKKKICRVLSAVLAMVMMIPPISNVRLVEVMAEESDVNYVHTPEGERTISTNYKGEVRKWTIDWSDEFEGDSLDTSKWSYMIGTGAEYSGNGWGNNEEEYYTNGENAVVSGGALTITARKLQEEERANYGGKKYTSTRLWSMDDSSNPGGEKTKKYTKTYGRIEARIRIQSDSPDGISTGLWPAFWMMPADDVYGTWAASGEIDIMEARGSNPKVTDATLHYGSQWPNNKTVGGHYSPDNPNSNYDESFTIADYHTYAIEWIPGEISWYMDDQLFYSTSDWYSTTVNNAIDYTYPAPFNQEFYLLLNLAVGGNYDGGALSDSWSTAEMDVDYVRVYDLVDEETNQIVDYDAMENIVVKPENKADAELISGVINETNFIGSQLSHIKNTAAYPAETERGWYLSNLQGGVATSSMVDTDTIKVDVTSPGTENYSVQLIHNVPLTKGYRYILTFDGKSDTSRTILAKFGNVGGYPAYSDSYSIDLSPDWKSYSYTFDMANTSDIDGRIEWNLGLSAGASYFKNFSIICTGLTPTLGEDDSKEPLADGNHIYNGTFDQGKSRIYFWHGMDTGSLSSSKAEAMAKVEGSSELSRIYQKGMKLLQADTYRIQLDGKADAPKDMTVQVHNHDGSIIYGFETFSLDGTNSMKTYTFDFTMPDAVNDTDGVFTVRTGNGTVYLDNISMIRTTNRNIDWSQIDIWPLYNGDFFNGTDGWNIWSENAGYQTHSIVDNALQVEAMIGPHPDFWCVGVQSPSMKLASGIPYLYTIHLNGSVPKTVKIETPDGVQKDYLFGAGDNQVEIEFQPKQNIDGKLSLYFGIGEGAYTFTIDSIDVEIDASKITIPEGYQKPASVTSNGDVKAGKDIIIKHNNSIWASNITSTYVNGILIDSYKVQNKQDGTILIAAEAMPREGTYSIAFEANGYTKTKSITQKVLDGMGNIIVNGTFDTDLNGWTTWFADWNVPNGTAYVEDGRAVMEIVSTEGDNWNAQLKADGLQVIEGEYYILQFDAFTTKERPIELEFENLGTPSQTIIDLTQEMKTYTIVLKNVPTSNNAYVLFMTGNVRGCLDDFVSFGNHKIYFDNVKLYSASVLNTPSNIVGSQSLDYKQVELQWNTVENASSYRIYRSEDRDGEYQLLGETSATFYADTKIKVGTLYYKIIAIGNGLYLDSEESSIISVLVQEKKVVKPPVNPSYPSDNSGNEIPKEEQDKEQGNEQGKDETEQEQIYEKVVQLNKSGTGATSIQVEYNKVDKAAGYHLRVYQGKRLVKTILTTKTKYTFKGLNKNTLYNIEVRPYVYVEGKRVYDPEMVLKTATSPSKVNIKKITATSKNTTLQWNKVASASGYEIYAKSGNEGYKKVKTINGNKTFTITIKNTTKDKKFTYKIRAYRTVDSKKVYGSFSKEIK